MENDIASSEYHAKWAALNKTLLNLKNANESIIDIREELN